MYRCGIINISRFIKYSESQIQKYFVLPLSINWGSSVCIESRLRAERPGFISQQDQWWDFFSSPPLPDRMWCQPNLLSKCYRGVLEPGVKRPWCVADRSPPSSAEIKNAWSYASSLSYVFMVSWCLSRGTALPLYHLCINRELRKTRIWFRKC
jgi:hypothetical protein